MKKKKSGYHWETPARAKGGLTVNVIRPSDHNLFPSTLADDDRQ